MRCCRLVVEVFDRGVTFRTSIKPLVLSHTVDGVRHPETVVISQRITRVYFVGCGVIHDVVERFHQLRILFLPFVCLLNTLLNRLVAFVFCTGTFAR